MIVFTNDGKEIQEELLLPKSEGSKTIMYLLETTIFFFFWYWRTINYTGENGKKKILDMATIMILKGMVLLGNLNYPLWNKILKDYRYLVTLPEVGEYKFQEGEIRFMRNN